MSQTAHFFIEYRRIGEPGWHLWQNLVPITKEDYDERMAEAKKQGYMIDDLVVREDPYSGNDAYYYRNDSIVGKGDLRDTFRISDYFSSFDPGMMNTGLPEDMSTELAAWDEYYKAYIKDKEYSYDWRGRIQWFTLGDLREHVDKLQGKIWECTKRYVRDIIDAGVKEDLDEIKKKLDAMAMTMEEVRNGEPTSNEPLEAGVNEDEEDEYPEDRETVESAWLGLEECIDYDVRHYGAAKGLYDTVYNIVHQYLNPMYGDENMEARVVYYIS